MRTEVHPAEFDQHIRQLLEATESHRVTLRVDVEGLSLPCIAEVTVPGVPTFIGGDAINHKAAGTIRWMQDHQLVLVQPDIAKSDIAPPIELITVMGVKSQMLTPVIQDQCLTGVLSVHCNEPRPWTGTDIDAAANVVALLHSNRGLIPTLLERRFPGENKRLGAGLPHQPFG